MSIPTATANAALNGITVDTLSLHSDWPGVTGLNEITGGAPAYARKAVTLAAASGAQRITSAAVVFDVPASTIRYIGAWGGSTFVGAMPNGGSSPQNFVGMPTTDLIGAASHGYTSGQKIAFINGTPPGGLTEGVVYFARDITTDSFKVAATSGGTAIDLTSGASFGCVVCGIVEDVFASQGTQTVTTVTFAVPT